MRAPKTRTRDHFLFSPKLRNASGAIIHRDDISVVSASPSHNRVVRFTAYGDVVLPGSRVIFLELDPLSTAINHNGGALHFGPDGNLYIAVGDNANGSNSQNLSNLRGKILRIAP